MSQSEIDVRQVSPYTFGQGLNEIEERLQASEEEVASEQATNTEIENM